MNRSSLFCLLVLSCLCSFELRANAQAARGGRTGEQGPNKDAFYKLGPDSMPMDGIPKGKWVGPTIIPSAVFPGYQHTYHVYVPAQYDLAIPTAVMVFNDGQAMMAEPGDVQAHNVLDNLIYRRENPVMLGDPDPTNMVERAFRAPVAAANESKKE